MHFIINFKISLVNFFNFLVFLLLTSEKSGGDTFLIGYFFDDHDPGLLLLNAILQFPISLTRKLSKKKNTHTILFFFEKSWAKFFLKVTLMQI